MQAKVAALKDSFSGLIRDAGRVGFADNEGLNESWPQPAATAERLIVDGSLALPARDLAAVPDLAGDHACLRGAISQHPRREFPAALRRRISHLQRRVGRLRRSPPSAKQQLDRQIQAYVDTFSEWALAASRVRPWVASIDLSSEEMLPEADRIIVVGPRARRRRRGHARGIAGMDAPRDHPCRLRGGSDRAGVQLADRTQHHAAARRSGAGDDTARRRRHLRAASPPPRPRTSSAPWRAPSSCSATP